MFEQIYSLMFPWNPNFRDQFSYKKGISMNCVIVFCEVSIWDISFLSSHFSPPISLTQGEILIKICFSYGNWPPTCLPLNSKGGKKELFALF